MARTCEVLSNETDIDFIDLNCGCPIDLIFKQGSGSALMARPNRLSKVIQGRCLIIFFGGVGGEEYGQLTITFIIGMTAGSKVPITVKLRTGVYDGKATAHNLLPNFRELGVSAITVG